MASSDKTPVARWRQYLIAGILTIIPIWVTWLIIRFLLDLLHQTGLPLIELLAATLEEPLPLVAHWLNHPIFQAVIAVVVVLVILLVVGWLSTVVLGRKLISIFDAMMDRIPMIKTIYGATKNLITSLQHKPDGVDRVVLIDFPSPEMKTVGFVTRTFKDTDTGRELAAVYVPTTPNPTSGYLEIVPVDKITATTWTVDEAMTFIVSGGATAPETMNFEKGATANEPSSDASQGTGEDPAEPKTS
jgi:uncharacterized membrane protein